MINLSQTIKRSPRVVSRKLKNQFYILDPNSGEIHILNETANIIWDLAKNKITLKEIFLSLTKKHKVYKLQNLYKKTRLKVIHKQNLFNPDKSLLVNIKLIQETPSF